MENYIFKVLNEDELCDKGLGKGLYSKSFTPDNYKNMLLSDSLNEINMKIKEGNILNEDFISCSKDLCINLTNYALTKQPIRPYLAVIKNHSFASFSCPKIEELIAFVSEYTKQEKWDPLFLEMYIKKALTEVKQCDIEKMVITSSHDIYNDSVYSLFFKAGLVKDKEEKNMNNVGNLKEVLVLNYISKDDIKILNPLQYDILYFLKRRYDIKIDSTIIRYLSIFDTENLIEISKLFEDKGERYLFENMYCQRKSIYILKNEIGFDNTIILKTFVLRKCIKLINNKFNINLPVNVNVDELDDILEKNIRLNDSSKSSEKALKEIFKY